MHPPQLPSSPSLARLTSLVAVALVGFASGPWRLPAAEAVGTGASSSRSSTPATNVSGYAELRIYHALPGKADAILERFRNPMTALKRRHGLNPLGCWASADPRGTNTVVVELLAPASEAAAALAWKAFAADPEFGPAYAASEARHGKTYSTIETLKLRVPPDARQPANHPGRSSRAFELRLYERAPGKESAFRDRWRDYAVPIYERHGMDSLGWWEATDPDHPRVMAILFAHESREAIASTIRQFHRDEDWVRVERETEAGGKLRLGVTVYPLVAADFSPIQ